MRRLRKKLKSKLIKETSKVLLNVDSLNKLKHSALKQRLLKSKNGK